VSCPCRIFLVYCVVAPVPISTSIGRLLAMSPRPFIVMCGRGDERVATTCRRWGQIVRGGWNIAAGRGPPAPSLSRTPTAPRLSIGSDSVTVNVPFPPTKNVALAPGCPPSVVCMPPMHPRRRSAAGASIIRRRCLTDATRAPNRSPRHLSTGSPCLRDRAGVAPRTHQVDSDRQRRSDRVRKGPNFFY
jgi:hypothetical protein